MEGKLWQRDSGVCMERLDTEPSQRDYHQVNTGWERDREIQYSLSQDRYQS